MPFISIRKDDVVDPNALAKDGSNSPTTDIDWNAKKIVNLADPVSAQDAATKAYADSLGGGGEVNTSSNLGAGEGLAAAKSGVDLPFKSLVGGTNVSLSSDANTVTINSTASGGSPGGAHSQIQYNSSGAFAGSPDFTWDQGNFRLRIHRGGSAASLRLSGGSGRAANSVMGVIHGEWGSGKEICSIAFWTGDDDINKDDGFMTFHTMEGNVNYERMRIEQDGEVTIEQNLRVKGNLGVDNSVAATTPGSVVKKIEIFDSTGASLGFIPVYDSIS